MVGWFVLNSSLYRVVSLGEGETGNMIDERKISKHFQSSFTETTVGPCSTFPKLVGRLGTESYPTPSPTALPHLSSPPPDFHCVNNGLSTYISKKNTRDATEKDCIQI